MRDVLGEHNHAVRLPAGRRRVFELRVVLALQPQNLELAAADDPPFHVLGFPSRFGLHLVARLAEELLSGRFRRIVSDFLQIQHGLEAEVEGHAIGVPRVELLRLAEGRVAVQYDLAEARAAAQGDGVDQPNFPCQPMPQILSASST